MDDQLVRDRALRLFSFLKDLSELSTKTVLTLDGYEKVLWFSDIPREPTGCHCIAWRTDPEHNENEEDDVWVEIKKPNLKQSPKPHTDLAPWLDPSAVEDSSREFPELRERISIEVKDENGSHAVFRELGEVPEIKLLWQRYVERDWSPWAEEDRKLQAIQEIYTDLFTIYQKQQRLGEAYEVVIGIGYLTWHTPGDTEVKRHIIAVQTSVEFDAARGIITVGPAGEGAKPRIEEDMLDPQNRPDAVERQGIEQRLNELGDDGLWDRIDLFSVIKAWTQAVSSRSQFQESISPQSDAGPDPKVHFAPAIILRKRTERSIVRVFEEICEQLRSGNNVPAGVKRLVTIIDDRSPFSDGTESEQTSQFKSSDDAGEIYFPLPANEQQQQIAKKLVTHDGVLVQGPPGTGKSHTIANLICHLLATGQRVLITSHSSRALRALLDRFSHDVDLKEIAGLCVILLGDDLQAMQALENSVAIITQQYKDWDPAANNKKIADIKAQLEHLRREDAEISNQLRTIREGETFSHRLGYGNYIGTAQKIATKLKHEASQFSWIKLQPEDLHEPGISNHDCQELLSLLKEILPDKTSEASLTIIDPEALVTPHDFEQWVSNFNRVLGRFQEETPFRADPSYGALSRVSFETRKALNERISELRTMSGNLTRDPREWVKEAVNQVLGERDRAWRELLNLTKTTLNKIKPKATRFSNIKVTGLANRDLTNVKAQAEDLVLHLESGGGLGFGPFRAHSVKEGLYLLNEVRIEGQLCKTTHLLRDLVEWVEINQCLEVLRTHWTRHTETPTGPIISQIAEYEDLCEPLEAAIELHETMQKLRQAIRTVPDLREPLWQSEEDVMRFQKAIEAVTTEESLDECKTRFAQLEATLSGIENQPTVHPEVKRIICATRQHDTASYREAYEVVCEIQALRRNIDRRNNLMARMRQVCPEIVDELLSTFQEAQWNERFLRFAEAWNWARANNWLRTFADRSEEMRLRRKLEQCRLQMRMLMKDLVAAKAWNHCMTRLSPAEREHLQAWALAVRRIGKGKGKYTHKHRRAAREHMEQCRSAIPAWIMPIYRVAESIRPGADSFDVVIVDEASQSGPEALFLNYLAKKIVVVGDDKQISPEFVGITRDDVELLRQRYLSDIPHNDALGVDNSFFDQAMIRFHGAIRLREHFRCMPEIIQFSNNLCYRSEPLIPLRQYSIDRLDPVIATRHVPTGYQKGNSPRITNPPEADAIVETIKKCCSDPSYKGKSMGVISLLGEEQAKLIERRLLDQLSPEEIEARSIVCGDAYAFQGTERDVMFLSLVSAPSETTRVGTLASPRDERRFNVATSRARDQMWLFHSATLSDLSPNCLRYKLLEYSLSPKVEPLSIAGLDLQELASLATRADRDREMPPAPFDSWFEVDVFLRVAARGYRVIPQLEVAGYRIDLVVEGMKGRLAVECDGDAWHGIERYEHDAARERMLTRCGWTFWRVRGSAFYRDPDGALEELWDKLRKLQIHSSSQAEVKPQSAEQNASASLHRSAPGSSKSGQVNNNESSNNQPSSANNVDDNDLEESEEGDDTTTLELEPQEDIELSQAHLFLSPGFLAPYTDWVMKSQPDPRSVSLDMVVPGLVDIIHAEGPIPCHRVYRLYVKAVGLQKVGRQIKSVLNRAIKKAIRQGLIEERNEEGTNDQINRIVRKPGTPAAIPRVRGSRAFQDIPPAEVGLVMKTITEGNPDRDENYLFQAVIKSYGFGRLTAKVRERLLKVRQMLESDQLA